MDNPWTRSPFPTRGGMNAVPQSGVVQSDSEWTKGWQDKIAAVPQYLPGAATGMSTPWWQEANINNLTSVGGGPRDAYAAVEQMANRLGITLSQDMNNGGFGIGRAADIEMQYAPQEVNPEWTRLNQDFSAAQQQRGENQIRQQQAYNVNMMGNNAVGGVMPANYADQNYGQVTGRVGGLGGLGGMDLTGVEQPSTGVYTGGSGAYNPTPFTPGNFNRQGWGGF